MTSTDAATARLVAEQDRFLKFVRARVADPTTALDVLQEAFVRAVAHRDSLRDDERVVAWFYRILRSTIIDLGRRRTAEARLTAAAQVDPTLQEEPAEESLARECLRHILPQLKAEHAELLEHVELQGETPADYAARQGITDSAFRVRRHRARKALRDAVESVCRCMIDRDADCVCAGGCSS